MNYTEYYLEIESKPFSNLIRLYPPTTGYEGRDDLLADISHRNLDKNFASCDFCSFKTVENTAELIGFKRTLNDVKGTEFEFYYSPNNREYYGVHLGTGDAVLGIIGKKRKIRSQLVLFVYNASVDEMVGAELCLQDRFGWSIASLIKQQKLLLP